MEAPPRHLLQQIQSNFTSPNIAKYLFFASMSMAALKLRISRSNAPLSSIQPNITVRLPPSGM